MKIKFKHCQHSTNINKINNHLSSQITELKQDIWHWKSMSLLVISTQMWQVTLVNGISTHPPLIIGYLTKAKRISWIFGFFLTIFKIFILICVVEYWNASRLFLVWYIFDIISKFGYPQVLYNWHISELYTIIVSRANAGQWQLFFH